MSISDYEQRLLDQQPVRRQLDYGKIARQVDIAMAHQHRPCLGGECSDPESPRCRRHENTTDVVKRYLRFVDWVRR